MGLGQKIRVVVDSKHRDEIHFKSGVKLYQDTSTDREKKTTLWATVVYVPPFEKAECPMMASGNRCEDCEKAEYIKRNHPHRPYHHFYCHNSDRGVAYNPKVGDKVCIRYDVFEYRPGPDKRPIYDNQFFMPTAQGHREEWMVNLRQIFMYEKNGEWHVVGEHVLCEPVTEQRERIEVQAADLDLEQFAIRHMQSQNHEYNWGKNVQVAGIVKIISGEYAERKAYVNPAFVQKYRFNENDYSKEYCIIAKRNILAVQNN